MIPDRVLTQLSIVYEHINEAISDSDIISEAFKGVMKRQTRTQKRRRKIKRKRAQRGTNWKSKKPRKGFKRVKSGKTYKYKRLTPNERKVKRKIGRKLGQASRRLKT